MLEQEFLWRDRIGGQAPVYRTLADRAYDQIRTRITTGSFAVTDAFTEADLSSELNMSKTPVREALVRLQAESFVKAIPRRGYTIAPIPIAEVRDLFAFRALIEGEAAALAATGGAGRWLEELEELVRVDSSSEGAGPDQISEMILINDAFHEAIALAAGNKRLHRSVVQVIRDFERFYFLEASLPEFYDPEFVDHREVLDAIISGSAERARQTMLRHLESSRRVLQQSLSSGLGPSSILPPWG
ncbi:GntR family transcriptional regulator [Salipiger pallidus]|uniref:GntR family transcriptional regulator n=1 Tax=Salipiger pallidus TaxID=1775170 RepID=A0A8J2ZKZ0_9RHOB|nr:GntR family transcriptional regulator [Salipiger pallidus]GGG77283.1 GntR family transcriptional regulator [Salipiger pallidus]